MQILSKHALGLDISDNSIELLELKKIWGKETVEAYARKKLESGIVERGRIINKSKLISALEEAYAQAKPSGFKTKEVILAIPEITSFLHVFKMPSVISIENIKESVQYEAEETIPITFDQTYHDYQIIYKDNNNQDVLYVAAWKKIIDDYKEVITKAGLKPIIIEAESMALARAFITKKLENHLAIVDLGAKTSIITVYDNNGIRYSNNISIGGSDLTNKISKELGVTIQEAARLKRVNSILGTNINGKNIDLKSIATKITSEIKKSINYHQKNTGDIVDKVVVCGGTSMMKDLIKLFNEELSIETVPGNPLENINSKGVFGDQSPVLFSTVVGLAKRGIGVESIHQGLNLLESSKDHKNIHESSFATKDEIKKEGKLNTKKIFKNKRMMKLLGVFILLIVSFLIILMLSSGKEEPLFNFIESSNPSGQVDY
ncbi:MAG: type IV pilus assembly protein PilM [Candidatus Kerfeldbacteria bacterium]